MQPEPVSAVPDGHELVLTSDAGDGAEAWTVLAATLALADALRSAGRVPAEVEWPDAVTLPRTMCGGAGTVQQVGRARRTGRVLEVRLQLTGSSLELPAGRTSVWAEGGTADPGPLAQAYALALARRLGQLRSGDPALALDYRQRCVTMGRLVDEPGGTAGAYVSGVDADGGLVTTAPHG